MVDQFGHFYVEEQDVPELPPSNYTTTGAAFRQSIVREHFS